MFQQTRNKILFLALVVPTLVAVLGGQARAQAANRVLDVLLIGQETNQWCWAATAQMTTKFAGVTVKQCNQCEQANTRFGHNDCCNSPTPATCIQPGWPDYTTLGFNTPTTTQSGTALTFAQLRTEIDANRPVNYSWGWTGGGGHMMMVVGYQYYSDTDKYVYIRDPWPPGTGNSRWITYAEFVAGADHVHWQDIYNIVKKP